MAAEAGTRGPANRSGLVIALFASLAVNLVAVGATAGFVWRHGAVLQAGGAQHPSRSLLNYASTLPPERLKELAIITAAREANNDYVWTAHERLARQQGVTDPIIQAIRSRTAPGGLSGDDAAVVRFTKELLTTHEIADATFNTMHQKLGNKGVMDLILLVLYYHSLAHALQAVKLEMPADTPSTL